MTTNTPLTTNTPPRIVGIGELLWDMLPPPAGRQLGGAVANFCYHCRALGARATLISAVGRDPLGRELIAKLQSLKLNADNIQLYDRQPTGTVTVKLEGGQPHYDIHQPVAWDFIKSTPAIMALAEQADAVCFGTLAQRCDASRQTIRRVLGSTRPETLRIFDVNFRQNFATDTIVTESLALANVLKLNDEELPILAKYLGLKAPPAAAPAASSEEQAFFKQLAERFGLRLIALTRGHGGSTLWALEGGKLTHSYCPPETIEVVDTVGAGDAFTAGLVVGMLAGRDLPTIHRQASRLASYVCTRAGATPEYDAALLDYLKTV